ncbi:MAG: hypothetical protein H0Z19_11400 [Archaeoglobus sp.]|nr:hypothetical protein [Archaeoglobus sp.]MBO8181053.1 hypothetical protein [Archaeoglobus sp.]
MPLSKAMVVLESMAMAASTAEMEPIMTTEKIGLHKNIKIEAQKPY